jgi:hypothetical protein
MVGFRLGWGSDLDLLSYLFLWSRRFLSDHLHLHGRQGVAIFSCPSRVLHGLLVFRVAREKEGLDFGEETWFGLRSRRERVIRWE